MDNNLVDMIAEIMETQSNLPKRDLAQNIEYVTVKWVQEHALTEFGSALTAARITLEVMEKLYDDTDNHRLELIAENIDLKREVERLTKNLNKETSLENFQKIMEGMSDKWNDPLEHARWMKEYCDTRMPRDKNGLPFIDKNWCGDCPFVDGKLCGLASRPTKWLKTNTHELKIAPQFFKQVLDGSKRYEVRKNDRNFAVGDEIVLKEYQTITPPPEFGCSMPEEYCYTGREWRGRIVSVLPLECVPGFRTQLDDEPWVVLGIEEVGE
jgi:hypothetical protein